MTHLFLSVTKYRILTPKYLPRFCRSYHPSDQSQFTMAHYSELNHKQTWKKIKLPQSESGILLELLGMVLETHWSTFN